MSNRQRRVSVIVPTCDRPAMLREALASIRALDGPDITFEILVGDNGQDAETRNVAEEFGAVYIPVSTKGAGAARNAGLRAATGEFIAFLDDDDVWLPTHLKRHIEILDTRPDVEGVVGQIITTDLELRQSDAPWPNMLPDDRDELLKTMLSGYYPQIGGTVARASVRDNVGVFDETLLGDQDWDWQLRIARRRTLAFAEVPCVLFRQRTSGSYDALRLRRLVFARRVFLRHALPEWRLWKSPREFAYSYRCVIQQYYDYFVDAAVSRADENDRRGALRAIFSAIRVFPLRSAYHLARMKPLGRAFLSAAWPGRRDLAKTTDISGSSFDRF